MIISFSFLSLLNQDFKTAIIRFNEFDNSNWLHFDVMDGEFVTNKTFNHEIVKEINSYNKLFCDVHLMVNNPMNVIEAYGDSGANQITFHYETQTKEKTLEIIRLIKEKKMKAGISIKPNTDVNELDFLLPYVDYILIMSVEPGKGGQKFIDSSVQKIRYLSSKRSKYSYLIGVDGGVNCDNFDKIKNAGADVIIVGTYLANNMNLETLQLLK